MLTLYTSTPVGERKTEWGKSECVIIPDAWEGLTHTTNRVQALKNTGAGKHRICSIWVITLGLALPFSIGTFGNMAREQARCSTIKQCVGRLPKNLKGFEATANAANAEKP
jgi:hypothetical protein